MLGFAAADAEDHFRDFVSGGASGERGVFGSGTVILINRFTPAWSLLPQLILGAAAYALIVFLVHRLIFPSLLADFVDRMPGASRLKSWLRLSAVVPRFA